MWYNENINKPVSTTKVSLEIGSKIFYPSHGAGWVKDKKEIEFGGKVQAYVEFEFINTPLSVSTPLSKIDELGIRQVYTKSQIATKLKYLKENEVKTPESMDFNALANILKDLETAGEIDSYIEIIQYCNYIRIERGKDGRLLPGSIDRSQRSAVEHIACELAVSTDTTLEEAQESIIKQLKIKL